MWPKFCMALVTTYDLFSEQNLKPLSSYVPISCFRDHGEGGQTPEKLIF